jgi:hypothetical protein
LNRHLTVRLREPVKQRGAWKANTVTAVGALSDDRRARVSRPAKG